MRNLCRFRLITLSCTFYICEKVCLNIGLWHAPELALFGLYKNLNVAILGTLTMEKKNLPLIKL